MYIVCNTMNVFNFVFNIVVSNVAKKVASCEISYDTAVNVDDSIAVLLKCVCMFMYNDY